MHAKIPIVAILIMVWFWKEEFFNLVPKVDCFRVIEDDFGERNSEEEKKKTIEFRVFFLDRRDSCPPIRQVASCTCKRKETWCLLAKCGEVVDCTTSGSSTSAEGFLAIMIDFEKLI